MITRRKRMPTTLDHKEKTNRLRNYDFLLVIFAILLSVIGVVAVTSADESLRNRQIMGIIGGVCAMIFISVLDYRKLLSLYWLAYAGNLVLLLLVRFIGRTVNNAQRWLIIGGLMFQPSEMAKILLILFYAQFIMKYRDKIKTLRFDLLCVLLLAPSLYLILRQPDLSTSIMLAVIFASIMFVGGVDRKLVITLLTVAVPFAVLVIMSASWENSPFLSSYQQERILAWLHPEEYATSTAYQTLNSLMAIGSGQLRGKGAGTNEITSVLNGGFISESQTDFIFTVIGEELGFVGACAVVMLLLFIALRCLRIARRSSDLAGSVIATSVACWIGFQGFMNIGVATGVVPNTGIPLPLVSSGLTSIICVFSALGFVLSVGTCGKHY